MHLSAHHTHTPYTPYYPYTAHTIHHTYTAYTIHTILPVHHTPHTPHTPYYPYTTHTHHTRHIHHTTHTPTTACPLTTTTPSSAARKHHNARGRGSARTAARPRSYNTSDRWPAWPLNAGRAPTVRVTSKRARAKAAQSAAHACNTASNVVVAHVTPLPPLSTPGSCSPFSPLQHQGRALHQPHAARTQAPTLPEHQENVTPSTVGETQ
jgi:hypothetical protein